jgi:hypothetical protein
MSERYRSPDVFGHDFATRDDDHRAELKRADKYEPSHRRSAIAAERADIERRTYRETARAAMPSLTFELPTVEIDENGNPIKAVTK